MVYATAFIDVHIDGARMQQGHDFVTKAQFPRKQVVAPHAQKKSSQSFVNQNQRLGSRTNC